MAVQSNGTDARAVVKDYVAGVPIEDICQRYGLGELALYEVIRGAHITRKRGGVRTDEKDAMIAGLYALLEAQATKINQLQRELDGFVQAERIRARASKHAAG